jgi:hypothetical protein
MIFRRDYYSLINIVKLIDTVIENTIKNIRNFAMICFLCFSEIMLDKFSMALQALTKLVVMQCFHCS